MLVDEYSMEADSENILIKNLDTGERTHLKDVEQAFNPLLLRFSEQLSQSNVESDTSESEEDEPLDAREPTDDSKVGSKGAGYVKVRYMLQEINNLFSIQALQAHEGPIWCLKLSKDGIFLASAGQDTVIRIWKVNACETVDKQQSVKVSPGVEEAEDSVINSLEKKKESKCFEIHINSLYSKEYLSSLPLLELNGHTKDILDLDWSKNGFLLSASMDGTVKLWHVSAANCLRTFEHSDFVTCVCFHPEDERIFLSGCVDETLRLWSAIDHRILSMTETRDLITTFAVSKDGKHLLVGLLKGQCKYYSLKDEVGDWCIRYITQLDVRSRRGKNRRGSKISGICFAPEQNEAISSNDSRLRCYRTDDFSRSCKYIGHRNQSSQVSATFSDDGHYIISGSEDKAVYIWEVPKLSYPRSGVRNKPVVVDCEYFYAQDSVVSSAIFGPLKFLDRGQVERHDMVIISSGYTGQIRIFQNNYSMGKRTRKVGIVGKYGTRYGASLRKQVKKMEIAQHAKYSCAFCGKDSVKRKAVGIWHCPSCNKTIAGGAWSLSTQAAATVRSTIRRLRETAEL
eukprot:jgi/Galph1/2917/GphlegSOOS_G1579.1